MKDGKAVGATDIMKRSGLNWYVDGNDLYETATTENILHINLSSLEYDRIPIKEGYMTIADINDDCSVRSCLKLRIDKCPLQAFTAAGARASARASLAFSRNMRYNISEIIYKKVLLFNVFRCI